MVLVICMFVFVAKNMMANVVPRLQNHKFACGAAWVFFSLVPGLLVWTQLGVYPPEKA